MATPSYNVIVDHKEVPNLCAVNFSIRCCVCDGVIAGNPFWPFHVSIALHAQGCPCDGGFRA